MTFAEFESYYAIFGSTFSFIGTIFSIIIFFYVGSIKNKYILKLNLPSLRKGIFNSVKQIGMLLPNNDTELLHKEFSQLLALLKNLEPKLQTALSKDCKSLIKNIKPSTFLWYRYGITELNHKEMKVIYFKLNTFVSELELLQSERG